MGRWQIAGVVLGCGLLLGLAFVAWPRDGSSRPEPTPKPAATDEAEAKPELPQVPYETVAVNPDLDVPAGFRGDVHPALEGQGPFELTAIWSGVRLRDPSGGIMSGTAAGTVDGSAPSPFRLSDDTLTLLRSPAVAERSHEYDAKALSTFLPVDFEDVGQLWSIDEARAGTFLEQFHPGVSTTFSGYAASYGRRAGPPGAFGVLRALSTTHAEIGFRIHAEFTLKPLLVYTPASFLGRMLIDRQARRVEYLEMKVPTDHSINVTLDVNGRHPDTGIMTTTLFFERVDRMALRGGERPALDRVAWDDALGMDAAREALRHCFYKFLDIDWVPFEDVLRIAKERDRPIFAVVLTSPLHDQAC